MDKDLNMDDEKRRLLEEQLRKAQASAEVDPDDLHYASEKGGKKAGATGGTLKARESPVNGNCRL